ncbi:MAG TPA: ribulose-phosphate 3-epimerase [Chloroflexota bacterium]|nr:ribulose-phosphate 3-epimerase [Chloroflexota bacterium]
MKAILMATDVLLAPSILAADFGQLREQVQELDRLGGVDRIHVDVMDGTFVPNLSFGPMIVKVIREATRLPLDVHLMIVDPGRYYSAFQESGADFLTVHVEACPHLNRDLSEIHRLGMRAGVALNPGTTPVLLDSILDLADLILVMSVNPGFGGQQFIESSVAKIARVRAMLDAAGSMADLSVDGGISPATAHQVVEVGANVLVAGSAVFRHPDGIGKALGELRRAAAGG